MSTTEFRRKMAELVAEWDAAGPPAPDQSPQQPALEDAARDAGGQPSPSPPSDSPVVPPPPLAAPPPPDTRGVDMRGRPQWFGDEFVRGWKGSKRPPDIHPTIWNKFMGDKDKREAIKKYQQQLERERSEKAAEEAQREQSANQGVDPVPPDSAIDAGPPTPPPPGLHREPPVDDAAPATVSVGGPPSFDYGCAVTSLFRPKVVEIVFWTAALLPGRL